VVRARASEGDPIQLQLNEDNNIITLPVNKHVAINCLTERVVQSSKSQYNTIETKIASLIACVFIKK
jgi:hypothetical protein